MSFVSSVLETTNFWKIANFLIGMSTFDVSGGGRVPTRCYSFVTWEHAEETEATIQVKQPLRKGKRLCKSCLPTWSSETTGLVSTWSRIAMGTHQKEHLEICSADPGTDQFTVHLYIYNIYITQPDEKRGQLKLGLDGPLQIKYPKQLSACWFSFFLHKWTVLWKKPTTKNTFFYDTMQTNITQSLYTAHVINIFRKLFTALHLVNI